jgi:hypothetical protein
MISSTSTTTPLHLLASRGIQALLAGVLWLRRCGYKQFGRERNSHPVIDFKH